MSCSVVYRTKRSNKSLSFCWTQFPSHWNIPRQELEKNRSPVCSCVCVCLIPSQTLVSVLRAKPLEHSQWKLPKVLMHFPPWHKPGSSWHSLMSDRERKRNTQWHCEWVGVLSVSVCLSTHKHMIACCCLTFQDDSDGVWSEAFSSRTQRLVLSCQNKQKRNTAPNHINQQQWHGTQHTVKLVLLWDLTVMVGWWWESHAQLVRCLKKKDISGHQLVSCHCLFCFFLISHLRSQLSTEPIGPDMTVATQNYKRERIKRIKEKGLFVS